MNEKEWVFILIGIIAVSLIVGFLFSEKKPSDSGVFINIISGTEYVPGQNGQVIVEVRDYQMNPIANMTCRVTILYPDKSYFVSPTVMAVNSVLKSHYYNFVVPYVQGVYEYSVTCNWSNKNVSDGKSFHVSDIAKAFEYEGVYDAKLNENVTSGWRVEDEVDRIYSFCCNTSKVNGTKFYGLDNRSVRLVWYSDSLIYDRGEEVNLQCKIGYGQISDAVLCEQINASDPLVCGNDCFYPRGIQPNGCINTSACDKNWTTCEQITYVLSWLWIYTIPAENNLAKWHIAGYDNSGSFNLNISTISSGCYVNQSRLIFNLTVEDHSTYYQAHLYCWNYQSSNWYDTSFYWGTFGSGPIYLCESAAQFNITNTMIEEVNEYVKLEGNVRAWIER